MTSFEFLDLQSCVSSAYRCYSMFDFAMMLPVGKVYTMKSKGPRIEQLTYDLSRPIIWSIDTAAIISLHGL